LSLVPRCLLQPNTLGAPIAMRTVTVERGIEAPPEQVFDVISDHARYERFRGIRGSELLSQGEPSPNGVGAVRRVLIGPLRFDEEIKVFERPTRMDYLIVRINVPFEHHGGSVRLMEDRGRTIVEWTSRFSIPTPVIGGIEELLWARSLSRGFRRVLEDVDRMLATS
jgi:Polyketide cyclase / dehydrase and lipid transport